jgi:hypothetical protein
MLVYGGITLFSTICIALNSLGVGKFIAPAVVVLFLSTWLSFITYLNQDADHA